MCSEYLSNLSITIGDDSSGVSTPVYQSEREYTRVVWRRRNLPGRVRCSETRGRDIYAGQAYALQCAVPCDRIPLFFSPGVRAERVRALPRLRSRASRRSPLLVIGDEFSTKCNTRKSGGRIRTHACIKICITMRNIRCKK